MSGYHLKPASTRSVVVTDWRRGHLAPGERVAAIAGWSVHAAKPGEVGLRVVSARHDAVRTRLAVEGGLPGRVYMLITRIMTDTGRALCRAVVVRIALDPRPD
jgi:hypothetical protein